MVGTVRGFVLGCVLIAAVLAAEPAQAGWRVDRAKQIAEIVWHHPCAGRVTVSVASTPVVDGVEADGAATISTCSIVLNARRHWSWLTTCYVVLHEYGHLAGFRDPGNVADPLHSSNPASVMWAGGDPYWDNRCASRGRLFLSRHRVERGYTPTWP